MPPFFRKRRNDDGTTHAGSSSSPSALFHAYEEDLTYVAPDHLPAVTGGLSYGVGPSGILKVRHSKHQTCPGFTAATTIIRVEYHVPNDVQKTYHPHPGVPYTGTTRYAYFPNNDEGCQLLARYKVAWLYGHMFKIGRSLTSGLDHQTTWTDLPNKTGLSGGPYGWPDPNYVARANAELDKLHIPSSYLCLSILANPPKPPSATQVGAGTSAAGTMTVAATTGPLPPPLNPNYVPTAPASASSVGASDNTASSLSSSSSSTKAVPLHPSLAPAAGVGFPVVMGVPLGGTVTSAPAWVAPASQGSAPTKPPFPLQVSVDSDDDSDVTFEKIYYAAPTSLFGSITPDMWVPVSKGDDQCAICLDKVSREKSVQIKDCGHEFHFSCLQDSLKHNPRCPVCRKPLQCAQGKSPSGTMQVEPSTEACPGFGPGVTAIRITYDIPSGIQKDYHDNPNVPYSGTKRMAYLPDNAVGRKLLKRLKFAWTHGLTFRVGRSLTTNLPNQVTWTSIHHKTSLHGGVHGFPDTQYISNVNASLDALNVP